MTLNPANSSRKLAVQAARLALEKKARDVKMLYVGKMSIVADYFLILTGNSATQVHTISDHLLESIKKEGRYALRVEGYREGWWVVIDYGDLVIHVFQPEAREFYNLERLWNSAPEVSPALYTESGSQQDL